jgi:hypothetical protein
MTERLTLKRVEAELPPMTSPENVKLRLEMIQNWSLAGMVPGAVAGACVRGCEVWHKVHDLELDRERTKHLERRVKELQDALDGRTNVRRA